MQRKQSNMKTNIIKPRTEPLFTVPLDTPPSLPPVPDATASATFPRLPRVTLTDTSASTNLLVELPASPSVTVSLETLAAALAQYVADNVLFQGLEVTQHRAVGDQTFSLSCNYRWSCCPCEVGQRASFVAGLVLLSLLHLAGDRTQAHRVLAATGVVARFLGPQLLSGQPVVRGTPSAQASALSPRACASGPTGETRQPASA